MTLRIARTPDYQRHRTIVRLISASRSDYALDRSVRP